MNADLQTDLLSEEMKETVDQPQEKKLGTRSKCCNATLGAAMGDGILYGFCTQCYKACARKNPITGCLEWLDGEPPWTKQKNLRRLIKASSE